VDRGLAGRARVLRRVLHEMSTVSDSHPGRSAGAAHTPPPPAGRDDDARRRRLRLARRAGGRLVGAIGVLWAAATFTFFVQAVLPVVVPRCCSTSKPASRSSIPRRSSRRSTASTASVSHCSSSTPITSTGWFTATWGRRSRSTSRADDHLPAGRPTFVLTVTALLLAWLIALVLTIATAKRGRLCRDRIRL